MVGFYKYAIIISYFPKLFLDTIIDAFVEAGLVIEKDVRQKLKVLCSPSLEEYFIRSRTNCLFTHCLLHFLCFQVYLFHHSLSLML